MKPLIILIGGAPTSGKSTLAGALSKRLDIPWISTDQLRNVVRKVVKRDDHPLLFSPVSDPEEFYSRYSTEEITEIEIRQWESVWPTVQTFIEEDYTWRNGFIIEGVNILPHLVRETFENEPHVRSVFIVDENEDHARSVIYNRGLWADADQYPDTVKEKEVEWVRHFSAKLKEESLKHDYPLVAVEKTDADTDRVLDALGIVAK